MVGGWVGGSQLQGVRGLINLQLSNCLLVCGVCIFCGGEGVGSHQASQPAPLERKESMTKITAGPEMLAMLRKAKAEGKPMTALAEKLLAEADGKQAPRGARTKLAAALYLLGASQRTIAAALDIQRTTVAGYVREYIPGKLREQAAAERDNGRSGVLLDMDAVEKCMEIFSERKVELEGLDAIRLAAKLQMYLAAPAMPQPESLEDSDGEPY